MTWKKISVLNDEQSDVAVKEWKREYFYSAFLSHSRIYEIKAKNLKYEKKNIGRQVFVP